MRKVIPVLLATAGGVALLAGFHTTPEVTNLASTSLGGTSSVPTVRPTATTAPPPVPTTARRVVVATTATTLPPVRYYDGAVEQAARWGPVQVRIAIRGRQLLDVQPLQMPTAHARSAQISEQAAPILRSEALQAQSARINTVSGASYTSVAYAESLQAALNQANA